jgi:translation initiation factor 1
MPRDNYSRTVYTTESGRICPDCGKPQDRCTCKKKSSRSAQESGKQGTVRLQLEKKGRGGKTVTVITGLPGSDDDLRALTVELKRRCGTGGTLKDGVIEIQGDHRETLVAYLKARGMNAKLAGG